MSKKFVYLFKEGNATMRELLGGKGANLLSLKMKKVAFLMWRFTIGRLILSVVLCTTQVVTSRR